MNRFDVVSAIVWDGDKVLLVKQYALDNSTEIIWTLPGGKQEPGETALESIRREIREEAGITVLDEPKQIYSCEFINRTDDSFCFVQTYEFKQSEGNLQPEDPDAAVLEAAFLPLNEAIEKLELLPFAVIKDPVLDYLRTKASRHWSFEIDAHGICTLVSNELFS